ncbi:hypothetical protein H0H92_009756, partial [Tricholoma furcatifolium]
NLTVPQFGGSVCLSGHQSKILVTDFKFGTNTLVYFTAEVLSHSIIDSKSVLALWLPNGETGEFRIKGRSVKRQLSGTGGTFHDIGKDLVYSYTQGDDQSVLQFDDFRIVLLPRTLAYRFWAPTLSNYPIVLPDQVYSDALPEASASYDDSKWVVADHTMTSNPTAPETLPVLYSDNYGFHTGVQIFHGCFTGSATAAVINAQGGVAFGWSAWLNGNFIGSWPGIVANASQSLTLSFANATVLTSEENVLTVVMDHSGHDELSCALLPRGLLGASLVSSDNVTFSKWTLAGNAGGESNIDPVRGVIAEGGLHAERLGWHLPGFDDSQWESRDPSDGVEGATIGFFRTTSDMNLPEGYDASVELIVSAPAGSVLRAQLYVNGYQYGKFVPQIGNQITFPIPSGILNVRGSNVI